MVFGLAFLAGALAFWERHARENAMSLGSAFLAGALFSGKTCLGRSYVFRVGFISRALFSVKTCPGKSDVSRVDVPSRVSGLLGRICLGKRYVSRVGVLGMGWHHVVAVSLHVNLRSRS